MIKVHKIDKDGQRCKPNKVLSYSKPNRWVIVTCAKCIKLKEAKRG